MGKDELRFLAGKFGEWELLKPQDKELFKSCNYEAVKEEINAIQSKQEMTKTMMNMKRIQPFIVGMAHFEKVLTAIGFHHATEVMGYVWGPVRFLLKTTSISEKAFDNVLDGYEQLGYKIPPLYEYTRLFTELPESEECLVHIYQDVLTFHKLAYKLFSLRADLWQKLFKATWKALGHTFKHLAGSLESHGQFIRRHGSSIRNPEADLDQANEAMHLDYGMDISQRWGDTKMEFYDYRSGLLERQSKFKEDEENRMREQRKSVSSWISPPKKTESLHKKFQDMRICQDTGRWLFRRYSEVTDWITDDQPAESAIWLRGSKGFGKTVLASLLIDELENLREKKLIPPESKTYYFYCQEDDFEHRTYLGILKGLLQQMVDADEDLLPLCVEKALSGGSTDIASAESLIEVFFEYNSRQYIVIDGLDECEKVGMREAATFLTKHVAKCDNDIKQGRLRVLFMSQPLPELAKEKCMPEGDACIDLRPNDNAEDIRAYVKKRIPEFDKPRGTPSGFNLSDANKEQIESIICRRSEGMFLYAHLAFSYLLMQLNKDELLKSANEDMLPEELSDIYAKNLGAIKAELEQLPNGEAHWNMAKLLLGWLVCAKRPLKWHEMQSILSYNPATQVIDFDNKMLRQNVKNYLGSLVHILDGDHIRIIHSTARRYVIQNKYINEKAVQCELTMICLRYLSLPCFSKCPDEDKEERRHKAKLGWFSFQDYACSQWYSHVDTVITNCADFFWHCREAYHHEEYEDTEYEKDFATALKSFINMHREDLTVQPHPDPDQKRPELDWFRGLSFYEDLCFLWNHIYTHQRDTPDARNTVGIAQLDEALRENRVTLEENFMPSSEAYLNDTIETYYGPNLFKCKRTLCKFFYLGYDKKKDRDNHDTRHERPYQCPVKCDLAPIGFSSQKDRDRHVKTYHPGQSDGPSVFEVLKSRIEAPQFTCTICGKRFTRNITRKGHERSHFGERPYACSNCGRAFARLNDCRRHEKIHTRRRQQ